MKKLLKILPLVAVGFAAILAFSGCDKILELMYPEETGTGEGGGTYGVTLRVSIATSVENWGSQIVVRLNSSGGATQDRKGYAYSPDGSSATFAASFDYVASDDYNVFAWLDVNGNGAFDPATEASGGRDWFHLPYTDYSTGSTMDHASFDVALVPVAGDSNAVTLKVLVDKSTFGAEWNMANLAVELRSMEGQWFPDPIRHGTAVELESSDPEYGMKGVFEVTYEHLPSGTYQLIAWVDAVNDSWFDTATEIGVTVNTDHGSVFPVPYYSPWDPGTTSAGEFVAYLYGAAWVDPSFWLSGPASVDRNAPGIVTMYVQPYATANTFSSVTFKIADQSYNPKQYYFSTDYVGASDTNLYDGSTFSFDIDFASWLSPALSDSTWDGIGYLIVQVHGTYVGGGDYYGEYQIALPDSSGGSYYNLTVNMALDEVAPWGYVDIYVADGSGYNVGYGGNYLDETGSFSFSFYSIYDQSGTDQQVYYYLYDQYWNYLGYYQYWLSGDLSGDLTLVAGDYNTWTQSW
jgi:hypothetical protein